MDPQLAAGLVIGGLAGIGVGRVWAENARARHDLAKTWAERKNYRKRK